MNSLHNAVYLLSKASRAWMLAAALLLAAQTVGIVHDLNPQNAPPDHVCEVCLLTGNLDHADVGGLPSAEYSGQDAVSSPMPLAAAPEIRNSLPPARGPPAAS